MIHANLDLLIPENFTPRISLLKIKQERENHRYNALSLIWISNKWKTFENPCIINDKYLLSWEIAYLNFWSKIRKYNEKTKKFDLNSWWRYLIFYDYETNTWKKIEISEKIDRRNNYFLENLNKILLYK